MGADPSPLHTAWPSRTHLKTRRTNLCYDVLFGIPKRHMNKVWASLAIMVVLGGCGTAAIIIWQHQLVSLTVTIAEPYKGNTAATDQSYAITRAPNEMQERLIIRNLSNSEFLKASQCPSDTVYNTVLEECEPIERSRSALGNRGVGRPPASAKSTGSSRTKSECWPSDREPWCESP